LLVGGHPAPLGARAFDLLMALVERRDRTVTKNELLDLVWPGLVVEENNLQVQISTLRKVLGQNAIATIPGQGYRFALQPEEAGASSSSPMAGAGYWFARAIGSADSTALEPNADTARAAPPSSSEPMRSMASDVSRTEVLAAAVPAKPAFRWRPAITIPLSITVFALLAWLVSILWIPALRSGAETAPPSMSVAILPFEPSSGEIEEKQFADALTRDLTSVMGRWDWKGYVVPFARTPEQRDTVINSREVGRALNVRYLAQAGVRRDKDKYIVTMRLLEAKSGNQVWAERVQLAASPSETARTAPHLLLAAELKGGLWWLESQRVVADDAHGSALELTLRGYRVFESDDLKSLLAARKFFDEALKLDPAFVPALWGTVLVLVRQGIEDPAPDRDQLVREMDVLSARAIRIDGGSARAWRARTWALIGLGRWEEAAAASDQALTLEPDYFDILEDRTHILQFSGRPAEALAAAEQVLSFDPQNAGAYHYVCKAHLHLGQYEDAAATCEKAAALGDHWWIQLYLTAVYTHLGDTKKAARAREQLLSKQPGFTLARYRAMLRSSPPAYFDLFDKRVAPDLIKGGIAEK